MKKRKKQQKKKSTILDDYRSCFDMFDKDRDGSITKKELKQSLREMNEFPTDSEIQDIIDEFDTNKSGTIYFDEFVSFLNRRVKGKTLTDELTSVFNVLDIDKKGYISADDVEMFLLSSGEVIPREEVLDMIKKSDMDQDGFLNYQEFVNLVFENL